MTRPAIIIGVGGTGQWILTFLKKDLLEIGGGVMPPGVRLLSFDTTTQTAARTGQGGRKEAEEAIRAGAVELTKDVEFIPIGDNVTNLVTQVSQGQHSYLQWFPAKTLLGKLPPSAFNTKEGSGQIRHMGRISVFRDLSDLRNSKVLSYIRAAIQDLQQEVSRDRQLEIIIIGSMAGGTGAGMLIDLALLVRAQASKLVQNNCVIRGFFILPRAFTRGGMGEGRDMLARAFASWRELDRFMLVSERFGVGQVNYHDQNQDLRIKINKRAYDVSYMVDPARQTVNSLDNVKAEEGLFPAVSHVISAILDDKAGQAYTEFISTNLAGKLAQLPRRAYHSAIGSYTLKVPVYYAREKFSHQMALDLLKTLLAPEVNDKGRVTRVSELRNREVAEGYAGLRSVLDFMATSALNFGGNEIPNTKYLPLVAEIRQTMEAQTAGNLAMRIAQGGLTIAQSKFLLAMVDISQDQAGKVIMTNIINQVTRPVWQDAPLQPSRVVGDTPEQAYTRMVANIKSVREKRWGIDTATGERLRGEYGKDLNEAKQAQLLRFTLLLQAWTANALNGQSNDATIARGGKLGYVRAFYDELAKTLQSFVRWINDVHQIRNEQLKLASRTGQAVVASQTYFNQIKSKSCPFAFFDQNVHPEARRGERDYLRAHQRDIDVRKDSILLDVLAETAIEMQAIAEKTRDEINKWIVYLATGDPTFKIIGLYPAAVDSLNNVNVNHDTDRRQGNINFERDKKLLKVSQVIGDQQYQTDPKHIAEALGKFKWEVTQGTGSLQLSCGIEFPMEDPTIPPRLARLRCEGENPTDYNLRTVLKLAERPYQTIQKDRPLAREVVKVYDNGTKLALALDKMAEPLYMTSATPQGPQVSACYIRVHSDVDDETVTYFKDFEGQLKSRNPNLTSGLTLVDSEDKHKLTVVRSDDLLPSNDFQMWEACREAYIQQVTDQHRGIPAAELHIFPAEINACFYEAEMPAMLGQNYRILHPEVVALLEDRERFEMFFRSVALGFIKLDESGEQPFWLYQLPADKESLYLTVPAATLEGRQKEDLFQVIHNFVMEGSDQRYGKGQMLRVDWGKLREAILSKQRDLGKTQVIKLYRKEIDTPRGVVQTIRSEVASRRAQIADGKLRHLIGQEHDDLADLATVVYLRAIRSVETM